MDRVTQIVKLLKKGLAQQEVADAVNCSKQYVSQVVQRYNLPVKKVLRWKKKDPEPKVCRTCSAKFWPKHKESFCTRECKLVRFQRIDKGFTSDQVRKIRSQRAAGVPVKELAVKYGVQPITIYKILDGSSYSYVK